MKRKIIGIVALALLGWVSNGGAKTTGVLNVTSEWNTASWTNGLPEEGDTVIIRGSSVITLTNETPPLATFIITNTARLVMDGWTTSLNADHVHVYATITHATNTDTSGTIGVPESWTPNARVYINCSNLTVYTSGRISANDVGYMGGSTSSVGFGPGGGFGTNTWCSGGAYGTDGLNAAGVYSRAYGSVTAPEHPGSGGGGRGTYAGGAGGGAVRIVATGNVRIDGAVTADSTVFYNAGRFAGGGSGGSIYITCQTLTGTGLVSAVAVNMEQMGSAGAAGGRIAVHYDTNAQASVPVQPTILFQVRSARRQGPGPLRAILPPGTLYLSDTRFLPSTVLRGGYALNIPTFPTNWAVDSLFVDNAWILFPSNGVLAKVTNTMTLSGSEARLDLSNDFVVGNLYVTNSAQLFLYSAATNPPPAPDYGRLITVEGTLLIGTNSYLYPYSDRTNGGSILFRVGNMVVMSNGWIFAYEAGFEGGFRTNYPGFGPGGGPVGGNGSSGGHGGRGTLFNAGYGTGGASNDVAHAPILPGSGGSGFNDTQGEYGGRGGGVIRIEAPHGTVNIDGVLLADGGNRANYGYTAGYERCGAGGSIFIKAREFKGKGTLLARGGTATGYRGTGGGGGRIAVWSRINDQWSGSPPVGSTVATNVAGGMGNNINSHGETGTVFWASFPAEGTLFLLR